MPLIEYKLHRTKNGNQIPDFVERHFGLADGSRTYVGWVPESNKRKYYVPDTIKELSKEDFIQRELSRRLGNESREEVTETEVTYVPLDEIELTENIIKEYESLLKQVGDM